MLTAHLVGVSRSLTFLVLSSAPSCGTTTGPFTPLLTHAPESLVVLVGGAADFALVEVVEEYGYGVGRRWRASVSENQKSGMERCGRGSCGGARRGAGGAGVKSEAVLLDLVLPSESPAPSAGHDGKGLHSKSSQKGGSRPHYF